MWTSLNFSRDIVARKEHTCYLCERKISKGEAYCLNEGVGDDGFARMRMHNACFAKTSGWDEIDWECHEPAAFFEFLHEKELSQ